MFGGVSETIWTGAGNGRAHPNACSFPSDVTGSLPGEGYYCVESPCGECCELLSSPLPNGLMSFLVGVWRMCIFLCCVFHVTQGTCLFRSPHFSSFYSGFSVSVPSRSVSSCPLFVILFCWTRESVHASVQQVCEYCHPPIQGVCLYVCVYACTCVCMYVVM